MEDFSDAYSTSPQRQALVKRARGGEGASVEQQWTVSENDFSLSCQLLYS